MWDTIGAWMSGFTMGLVLIGTLFVGKIAIIVVRTERKVDALLRHSGVDLLAVANQEVESLVKAGRKIEAIKAYRELTGASLAEAKAAVERMG